ncbi:unnamed protein product [Paramecium primaurelia]|uniref:CRC domain-containing protein n=1 Tax=Paramecium primaurelia TaxID=5886 RepID=A0A8S1PR70_PARPR|nr:unnamed protein product [Paramecium primaurelia]
MHQNNFCNQSEKRKESNTMTYDYQNTDKFDINLDNDVEQLPMSMPQLKNIMSILSDKFNEELESPIIMKVQTENPIEDVENDKYIQEPNFKIQVQPSKQPKEIQTQNLEHRNRRIHKQKINNTLIRNLEFNQESDLNSLSNEHTTTPCNCSNSHCLKLYCQCFHQNKQCTELCKCVDCKNYDYHLQVRQTALEKIKIKSQRQKHDNDLFDLSKVWGCKCQKSKCQKNYCECYIRNQKCTSNCKCKDCANKKRIPVQLKKKKKIETVSN